MQYADPTKLRAYFFGNMYLSPIQQGIQCSHVVTVMFVKYGIPCDDAIAMDTLYHWGKSGVTKILLNGGYQSNLADIYSIFEIICPKLGIPFSKFHEEEAALNGALTSVGIVVPEEIYGPVVDDMHYEQYYSKNIGGFRTLPVPAAYHARVAVQAATPTPLAILNNIKLFGHNYDESDYLLALHLTLKTARLA